MKIHLFGNVLNWGMTLGRLLYQAGHDVTVFVSEEELVPAYQPRWEFPEFSPKQFPFVEPVAVDPRRLLWGGRRERAFLKRLAKCDVIQTFGEYSILAMLSGRPYVVLSYGADLEVMPFAVGSLKHFALRVLIRRAFRAAGVFVYALPKHKPLVRQLGLTNAVWDPYAVPIDTARYAPLPDVERLAQRRRFPQRVVLFHGARQEWVRGDTNDKANDVMFLAFARFVRTCERDALLIAVRRGRDVAQSEALVRKLGLTSHVQWVEELDKPDLVRLLNSVDGFCDQFAHGFYGVASLEALACGVPTFVYLNADEAGEISLPPVFSAQTEEQLFQALDRFAAQSPAERAEASQRSRAWVAARYNREALCRRTQAWYCRAIGLPAPSGLLGSEAARHDMVTTDAA